MTDFEKKLKAMRLSGETGYPKEIDDLINSIGSKEAILLEERINTKVTPYYTILDMVHILLHDLTSKYNIKPIDYIYSLLYICKLTQITGVKNYIEPIIDAAIAAMSSGGIPKDVIARTLDQELDYVTRISSKE